jgi:hypothetical protein
MIVARLVAAHGTPVPKQEAILLRLAQLPQPSESLAPMSMVIRNTWPRWAQEGSGGGQL